MSLALLTILGSAFVTWGDGWENTQNDFRKEKKKKKELYKDDNLFFCHKEQYTKQSNDNMKGAGKGERWVEQFVGVFLKSTSESYHPGSRRVQFTEERITMSDYLSRVIKAVPANSIITHLIENEGGGDWRRRGTAFFTCYCALVDLPDGFRDYYCPLSQYAKPGS